jgi:hypothetical protein
VPGIQPYPGGVVGRFTPRARVAVASVAATAWLRVEADVRCEVHGGPSS